MVHIMIVAKHAEVREGLCTVLRLAGDIEVIGAAASLTDAVNQALKECPDVALVDLEMPEGEGYETIRQFKNLCMCTKVIALTAHEYPAARERALYAGASMVMVKGLDLLAMAAGIRITASEKGAHQGETGVPKPQ